MPTRLSMKGKITNLALISSNEKFHVSSNSNFASFSSCLHNGLAIFEKSWMNLL